VRDKRIVTRKAGERRRGRTDLARLAQKTDAEIEDGAVSDADNPPATAEWLARAKPVERPMKEPISIRIDSDVLAWFRAQGDGYQSIMNAVLRSYVEHSRMAAAVAASVAERPKLAYRAEMAPEASAKKPRRGGRS
jgi:uncharacterized protein (DUF4415 family)